MAWPFDSHNHLQRFARPAEVIAEMQAAGIAGCVANGTGEEDWPAVAALAGRFPDYVRPAYGVHPWQADRQSAGWRGKLEALLDADPQASVGEIGLDGWIGEPALEIQRAAFLPQLALARERGLPVTIHALKAWEPLLDAFRAEPPPPRWLLHSYGGSVELVKRLADLGAWFSFSGYFLHPRKEKVRQAFRAVPADRLLVETDAPDMLPPADYIAHRCGEENHPANLRRIAMGLAESLERDAEELMRQTAENHRRFFGLAE